MLIPDELLAYALEKSFENNPTEGIFGRLKNQENVLYNNNNDEDDKIDDGLWHSSVEKPHVEYSGKSRAVKVEKISKRFRPNSTFKSDDFKGYFYY